MRLFLVWMCAVPVGLSAACSTDDGTTLSDSGSSDLANDVSGLTSGGGCGGFYCFAEQ